MVDYCLQEYGKFPHEYDALGMREKALVIALVHRRWEMEVKRSKGR